MKVYRVGLRDVWSEHKGYLFYSSKSEAEAEQKKDNKDRGNSMQDEVTEIEFDLTKKGVIEMLNQWASHPDNG
jgi:hypothetical protein